MKKVALYFMLLALLAAPMLACGFPLPAGTQMMAVSKAACPETEPAETCEARRDAYQLMSKLHTVSVEDLSMSFYVNDGESTTDMLLTGSYDYQVVEAPEGIGANVRVSIEQGTFNDAEGAENLNGAQLIVIGDTLYASQDGGQTWQYQTMDSSTLSGLSLLLGVGGAAGAGLDLFSDPGAFTVTVGAPVELDGQTMQVQTLTLDLAKFLSNTEALSTLVQESMAAGGEALGMDSASLQEMEQYLPFAAMFAPFTVGSEFTTTLYIGQEDGYIHRVEEKYLFKLDASGIDPESSPLEMRYELAGSLTGHNSALAIEAPAGATEGGDLLGEGGGLFGSDLGSSLFGQ